MIRTGLPRKPGGAAADACPISASAAMAAPHANPPATDRPMPCAPSAILARRAHGAASAFTRVDAKENTRRRPASERLASAQSALEQARNFDRSGQETQCMDAIARAKGLVH